MSGIRLMTCAAAALAASAAVAELPDLFVRDDGRRVDFPFDWFPRQGEICRKYERTAFGRWLAVPKDFRAEELSCRPFAAVPGAVEKRLRFSWGTLYGRRSFEAVAVIPRRDYQVATFTFVTEDAALAKTPADDPRWPVETIVRHGYATVGFDGSQLTPPQAADAVSGRAWALSRLYDWLKGEKLTDETMTAAVGCGRLDGLAALWHGCYDWRLALTCAAQCGVGPEWRDLVALGVPRLLFVASSEATGMEQVRREFSAAREATAAWTFYRAIGLVSEKLPPAGEADLRGMVGYRWKAGAEGLDRDDWRAFVAFADRHNWNDITGVRPVNPPPLMTTYDGAKTVTTREEWERVRRPEIVRYFTENVYGAAPTERPEGLRFERRAEAEVTVGGVSAVRHEMTVRWRGPLGEHAFDFLAYVPKAPKKVPAVVFIANRRKDRILGEPNTYWDVAAQLRRGVAAIAFWYGDVVPDRYDGYSSGAYLCWNRPGERSPTGWGAITAWAWAASRVMDWVETVPAIDSARVGVAGHSRCGKAALWAGVRDTRFALVVPQGSGRTGMMLNHIAAPVPTEPISRICANFPFWFSPRYAQWANREFETPFDHHHLAACVAPRLLYVENGSGDMTRHGEFWTARLASPAWELYGRRGLVGDRLPDLERPDNAGCVGYYLRNGPHDVATSDWDNLLDFAEAHDWGRSPLAQAGHPVRDAAKVGLRPGDDCW